MNQYIKVFKIALGSTVAILIAYAIGLDYAVSAGVITLLTLQDTKKETMFVALKRIGAFVMAVVIALLVFSTLSYNPIAYGVFLLVFAGICYYLKIYDAIPMNAVLATHYFLEKNMSVNMVCNEALLLLTGAGVGIILNLYIPSNIKLIRNKQRIIEDDLKSILSQMAEKLMVEDKSDYDDACLEILNEHIRIGLKQAYTNMNNSFFQETRYYIEYMEMRKQQYKILKEIYLKIKTINQVTLHARDAGGFIVNISESLSESQNAKGLLEMEENLLSNIKKSSLPQTRDEFENRAVLYMILMDFRIFLKLKEDFADSLTEEQKNKYWKSDF
jgi:uncharacterized membrane protein YgaE (UPF0421/DUF939 family)